MSVSLLSIGARGLAAAQASMATTSHNIANAGTAGYSRQEAVLTTSLPQSTGSGFFGTGVDVSTVRRQYDQFLAGAVQAGSAQAAADGARADSLGALDGLFGDAELGVGAAMDNLFGAIGDVANRPADMAARQTLLSRLQDLAGRFNTVGAQIDTLASQADARLAQDAGLVNQRLGELRQLNEQIAHFSGSGQPPNDLLDQRDQALLALGGLMDLRTVAADNGAINVYSASGAPLLVGTQQATLATQRDPANTDHVSLVLQVGATRQPLDEAALGGGSLAGTLRFRDGDLASASARLGQLALAVAGQLNAQQALGVDAGGAPGQPLLAVAGPAVHPNATNTGSGALGASVVDTHSLQPSDYRVRWDGAAYQVTRLSDQQVSTVSSLPATLDGLRIALSGGAPAAGDSWLLQPYAQAATSLRSTGLGPAQLASGYAAMPQLAAGNSGGAQVADFAVVRAGADNTLPVTLSFNDPPTSFNITGLAGGDLANVPYVPGQSVPPAPADYNGWRMVLTGAPAAGDSVQVQRNPAPAADNRNALALGRLADAALVQGGTLNQAYAGLVGDVGTRVQSARALADVSGRMQSEAVARRENVSGVNLDEEAANLLRFQQAYQACARIIQASQSVFDSLLAATR